MKAQLDFGYPWWLSYGHLIVVAIAASLLAVGYARRWSRAPMLLLGVLALWSTAAFFAARFVLNVNGRAVLPTESFLRSGAGRVLDMGTGTGRSSIMVLEARPQTTLVALDLFGESYAEHFGQGASPQERLLANLKAAGVERRVAIRTGDMRELPFEPAAFDAIVSSYAIDHLNREGVRKSLAEAARVLKPGGEFLLILIAKDPWLQFTFGPLLFHSGARIDMVGQSPPGSRVSGCRARIASCYPLSPRPETVKPSRQLPPSTRRRRSTARCSQQDHTTLKRRRTG